MSYASSLQACFEQLDSTLVPHQDTLVTPCGTKEPVETQAVTGVAETHGGDGGDAEE